MKQDIEIPQGYKNSPLGVIPKEWETKKLGEIGTFFKGKGVPKNQIINNGYKCLTYGDLYTKYDYIIKNVKSFINQETTIISQKIHFGDICFAGSGETTKDIGKCATFIDDKIGYAGGDIIILRTKENPITLSYILNSEYIIKQKSKYGQGHSVVHIYPTQLKKIDIALPPLIEQQKIADILSTWDKAIEKQTKIIELLEQRKHGLMQQLLTGKKRLKGFTDKWKTKNLEQICIIKKGKQVNKVDLNMTSKYPAINGGLEPSGWIDKYNKEENTITISEGGNSCGFINLLKTKFWCGGHCYAIKENLIVQKYFLYYILKFNEQKIMNLRVGSGLPNIQIKSLLNFKIKISSVPEQTAISKILTEADNGINLSKKKLDSLYQQKKGLMQVLLTGKKRVK